MNDAQFIQAVDVALDLAHQIAERQPTYEG